MATITKQEQIFDVRLIERHLHTGKISKKDLEGYLKALPDKSDNVDIIPREALFDIEETESEDDE